MKRKSAGNETPSLALCFEVLYYYQRRITLWIVRVRFSVSFERVDNPSTIPSADSAFQSHLTNAINELKVKSEKKVV